MFPRAPELAIIHTEFSGAFSSKFFLTASTRRSLVSVQVSITLVWRSTSVISPRRYLSSVAVICSSAWLSNSFLAAGTLRSSTEIETAAWVAYLKPRSLRLSAIAAVTAVPWFLKDHATSFFRLRLSTM